jgi:hypothetical protein
MAQNRGACLRWTLHFWAAVALVVVGAATAPERGNAAIIWNGPLITYNQPSPDPTQAANQDRITPNVWITRAITEGIFNAKNETSFTHFFSPADTTWADGDLTNFTSLSYHDWDTWAKTLHGGPPNTVGVKAVVHLVSEDIYIGIQFTKWAVSGGGFAYQRTTAPVVVTPSVLELEALPNEVVLSWTNSAFGLQSATNVAGPFLTISGASSPFTNSTSSSQRFFRLIH